MDTPRRMDASREDTPRMDTPRMETRRVLVARPGTPAVVSKQLCNLLLSFPSAASGGVKWSTLAKQYEERHGVKLDLNALGFDSAVAAATTLLWDVLRVVDSSDLQNPIIAVEDAVAMTPRGGSLGTWPSLYQTVCRIVRSQGVPELQQAPAEVEGVAEGAIVVAYGLPLSKVTSLLQTHWHESFAESQLGFTSDDGLCMRLKNLRSLVQALAQWREQRLSWSTDVHKHTDVDEAIMPYIQLVQCSRQKDLVLRVFQADATQDAALEAGRTSTVPVSTAAKSAPVSARCTLWGRTKTTSVGQEIAKAKMAFCTGSSASVTPVGSIGSTAVPSDTSPRSSGNVTPAIMVVAPELQLQSGYTTPATTSLVSSVEVQQSAPGTPLRNAQPGAVLSGSSAGTLMVGSGPCFFTSVSSSSVTPRLVSTGKVCTKAPPLRAQLCGGYALISTTTTSTPRGNWLGDRGVIPNGIVQSARARFETTSSALTSPATTPREQNAGQVVHRQSPRT